LDCEREKANEVGQVPTSGYNFLPHTTDAYIEAVGSNLEEALNQAGLALFDTMCDVQSISQELKDTISVQGSDKPALLYNWLEALLLKFELEQKVYNDFQISLTSTPQGELKLNAEAAGEYFNREKHHPKVEVKAVTYHRMEVREERNLAVVRFILDL
jgi:SHS2 domain-containing protein